MIHSLKAFLQALEQLIPRQVRVERQSPRGRRPKRSLRAYLKLIIVKEAKRASLRRAEAEYSRLVCGQRVPKSTLHWWECRFRPGIEALVKAVGRQVERLVGYAFSILDATAFTTWRVELVKFHLLVRRAGGALYPVAAAFGSAFATPRRAIVPGQGELFADAEYDSNAVLRAMFKAGYRPRVKPNRPRARGHWRRKARRLFNSPEMKWLDRYRLRGIGEGVFGSLTVWLGDRLPSWLRATTETRIAARIIAYLARIYLRARSFVLFLARIFGHAPEKITGKAREIRTCVAEYVGFRRPFIFSLTVLETGKL